MNLENRLRKLESIHSFEPKIIVVKFGNEINQLSCGGEIFQRSTDESEKIFVERVKKIIEGRLNKPPVSILVANF